MRGGFQPPCTIQVLQFFLPYHQSPCGRGVHLFNLGLFSSNDPCPSYLGACCTEKRMCSSMLCACRRAVGLERAADKPGHEVIGTISLKHIYEIAIVKRRDIPNVPLEAICKNLMSACRSMGVQVVR